MLAQVAVPVAVVLDDPPLGPGGVLGHLVVVDGPGRGYVEDPPAGVPEPLAEVGLVRVDEEVADRASRPRSAASRRTIIALDCTQPTGRVPVAAALDGRTAVQEDGAGERGLRARQPPGAGHLPAVGGQELRAGGSRLPVRLERAQQSGHRARLQLRVLVEQQAELAARLLEQAAVVGRLALAAVEGDQPDVAARGRARRRPSRRRRRCRAPGSRARDRAASSARSPRGSGAGTPARWC